MSIARNYYTNQESTTLENVNCINKITGPLNRNCLLENILYIATIKSANKNYKLRNYKGMTKKTIKEL